MSDKGRLVYSTGLGSICPGCGWPDKDCKCSSQRAPSDAIPSRVVAKLRMEKKFNVVVRNMATPLSSLWALDIDPKKVMTSPIGRTVKLSDGNVVKGLLG